MMKKILVAFDDSENAMRAVEYIAKKFNPENKVTLFSVAPDTAALCEMNSPELGPYFVSQQSSFCILENKKKELMNEALNKAKDILIKAGFNDENVTTKMEIKKEGIARDLVNEAQAGYGLIVMGRRGLSGVKEFFIGSISQKVFTLAKDVSVLIVN
ncbi:UspA domain-containing protein [Candidatus Magnetomoraceae bacterium gMMP-15]